MFALRREPDLLIYRQNVGAVKMPMGDGRERFVRFGLTKGASDLLGVLAPDGRIVAIELKSARGRTTPEQDAFLSGIRAFGGFACVVRSADEARAAIERARKGGMK
jgi:VRR-NUC domain